LAPLASFLISRRFRRRNKQPIELHEDRELLTIGSPANYYSAMPMFFTLLLPILLAVHTIPSTIHALERHIHARAGGSSAQQLPLIVAKDLGLFEKYGLDLDLLEIRGGSLLMQALIGQSVNSGPLSS
jgi:hypothetical protein